MAEFDSSCSTVAFFGSLGELFLVMLILFCLFLFLNTFFEDPAYFNVLSNLHFLSNKPLPPLILKISLVTYFVVNSGYYGIKDYGMLISNYP